jgi:hypothetical protein
MKTHLEGAGLYPLLLVPYLVLEGPDGAGALPIVDTLALLATEALLLILFTLGPDIPLGPDAGRDPAVRLVFGAGEPCLKKKLKSSMKQ